MIPRFIHEKLLRDSKKLVEVVKKAENIKAENNMETKQKLKIGDKIVCIIDSYKDFTKGKEYEIINIDSNNISVLNDYRVSINFLSLHNTFKLKEETAYKETEGKLFYELDFEFIKQMAERMAANKGKYEPYNWQQLDNIADLKQSLFRHVLEIMNGNYEDDNRVKGHLEAVAINAMFINYQLKRNNVSHCEEFKGILNSETKITTTDSTGLLSEDNYKKMIEQWKNKSK